MNKLCVFCHYARMRDDICGIYCTGGFVESNGKCKHYKDCEESLKGEEQAAANAVPVVRCKDCYYSAVVGDTLYCTFWSKNTDENGYCHEGG